MQEIAITKASPIEKGLWLGFSYLLFGIVYYSAGKYAQSLNSVLSFVFDFEYHIPFLPWMIIPYMSSGLFFCYAFYLCDTKSQLYVLAKRINFLTIVSGILFVIIPLKNAFIKPDVTTNGFNYFYQQLQQWDTPFNQAPSLHVGYACVYWTAVSTIKQKMVTNFIKRMAHAHVRVYINNLPASYCRCFVGVTTSLVNFFNIPK